MNGARGTVKVSLMMALLALGWVGCLKTEEFPNEPRITGSSFAQFADSASLTVFFTDGDGDVGLDDADDQPPFDVGSDWYFNLFVEYEELQNGEWVRPNLLLPLYYRIPRLSPTGRNRSLRGEISVALKPWPIIPRPPGSPDDTVRFSVHMVDRSLNVSNSETTPEVIIAH